MNLHAIANAAIQVVNPNIIGSVQVSTGYTTAPTGKRTPTYALYTGVPLQVQAMNNAELHQLAGMNLQGNMSAVYISGAVEGLERQVMKGGDVLTFSGSTWLVKALLEDWGQSGWCKVAVVQQSAPATQ